MQYEVIELSKFTTTPSREKNDEFMKIKTQPFCMIFVYAPQGNFLIKGMYEACRTYLKQHFLKYVAKITTWCKGLKFSHLTSSRGIYITTNDTTGQKRKRKKFVVRLNLGKEYRTVEFRHLPKKWIPIYDEVCNG